MYAKIISILWPSHRIISFNLTISYEDFFQHFRQRKKKRRVLLNFALVLKMTKGHLMAINFLLLKFKPRHLTLNFVLVLIFLKYTTNNKYRILLLLLRM